MSREERPRIVLSLSFLFSLSFSIFLALFPSRRTYLLLQQEMSLLEGSKVEGTGWERQRLSCRHHHTHGSALGPASRNNNYLSRVLWCPPTCSHSAQRSYIDVPGGRRKSRIRTSLREREATCLVDLVNEKIEITVQSLKLQDW